MMDFHKRLSMILYQIGVLGVSIRDILKMYVMLIGGQTRFSPDHMLLNNRM